ncbi:MAG: hypothetical protein PHN51_11165 [Candidatus Nanopelagicales bacterium]|nr:hypothetical protein [Candidatus Nanopelagicales bacterium]
MSQLITFGGLPLHPLVVHVVVVLVPLTALGAILMAVMPRFSRRFGPLVALGAFISMGSAVLAKEAGEQLALVKDVSADHLRWGDQAPLWVGLFGLVVIVFWFFDRGIPANRSRPMWLRMLAFVVIALSLVATVFVLGAGHSGAEAVWASLLQ